MSHTHHLTAIAVLASMLLSVQSGFVTAQTTTATVPTVNSFTYGDSSQYRGSKEFLWSTGNATRATLSVDCALGLNISVAPRNTSFPCGVKRSVATGGNIVLTFNNTMRSSVTVAAKLRAISGNKFDEETVSFRISPNPRINSLSPSKVAVGQTRVSFIVNGSNFQDGATVIVSPSGGEHTAAFVSSNQISFVSDIFTTAGNYSVTVKNPDGQASSGRRLTAVSVSASGSSNQGTRVCTQEAKLCPDGSYVGRTGPNCEFTACPLVASNNCARDLKLCPDGSTVARRGSNCEFAACPTVSVACARDAKVCSDGSVVTRTGANCVFADCPTVAGTGTGSGTGTTPPSTPVNTLSGRCLGRDTTGIIDLDRRTDSAYILQTKDSWAPAGFTWAFKQGLMHVFRFKTDGAGYVTQTGIVQDEFYTPTSFISPAPCDYGWAYQHGTVLGSGGNRFDHAVLTDSQANNIYAKQRYWYLTNSTWYKPEKKTHLLPNTYYYLHVTSVAGAPSMGITTNSQFTAATDSVVSTHSDGSPLGRYLRIEFLDTKIRPGNIIGEAFLEANPSILPFPWTINGKTYSSYSQVEADHRAYVFRDRGVAVDQYPIFGGSSGIFSFDSRTAVFGSSANNPLKEGDAAMPAFPWTINGKTYESYPHLWANFNAGEFSFKKVIVDGKLIFSGKTPAITGTGAGGGTSGGTRSCLIFATGGVGTCSSTDKARVQSACCPNGTVSSCSITSKSPGGDGISYTATDCDTVPPEKHYVAPVSLGNAGIWYGEIILGSGQKDYPVGTVCAGDHGYYILDQSIPMKLNDASLGEGCENTACYVGERFIQRCQ